MVHVLKVSSLLKSSSSEALFWSLSPECHHVVIRPVLSTWNWPPTWQFSPSSLYLSLVKMQWNRLEFNRRTDGSLHNDPPREWCECGVISARGEWLLTGASHVTTGGSHTVPSHGPPLRSPPPNTPLLFWHFFSFNYNSSQDQDQD